MSEAGPTPEPAAGEGFRWQGFFQRAADPLFLLNRRRRFLFVNRAWEALTGLAAHEVRGRSCTRARPLDPGSPEEILCHVLCPPRDVLRGLSSRVRRFVTLAGGRAWWDVEFLPLREEGDLLGILGRITPRPLEPMPLRPPLPEVLLDLRAARSQRYRLDDVSGASPAMQRVANQVHLAAQTWTPVLLRGAAGTGKEWVARTIHHHGVAREGCFVALDCARLPAPALSEILLGEGGLLRAGTTATLYLREPARLPSVVQDRLCEHFQEEPAGKGHRIRLLAGCRGDPAEAVRAGQLLEAFHALLSTLTIELPPLRERLADLPRLVDRLLERANAGREVRVTGLTAEAWELLRAHAWPGNLRELATVLGTPQPRGPLLEAADLPAYLRLAARLEQVPAAAAERPLPLDSLLEQVERRLIQLALRRAQGNKTRAAELLAVWRPRLVRRLEALGLAETEPPPEPRAAPEP